MSCMHEKNKLIFKCFDESAFKCDHGLFRDRNQAELFIKSPDTLIRDMLCVSLCISAARKHTHTHTSGPCAFTDSPHPDGCFVESLPLRNYSDMKVVFFFPHYFWSERQTELPGGVWESDRRPRGLEHPAFKRAASERDHTKACDQTEIPSGEKLLYMHWATVMEKSSGEGNQIALEEASDRHGMNPALSVHFASTLAW